MRNARLYLSRLAKARRLARKLVRFPFVREVHLTGSLARRKVNRTSDIDFFIKARRGRIYLARLIVVIYLILSGQYRHEDKTAGKICPNWWATYNVFSSKGRHNRFANAPHCLLARRNRATRLENLLGSKFGDWLEGVARAGQVKRFRRDSRTHALGSAVRWSDSELGFHPPKQSTPP